MKNDRMINDLLLKTLSNIKIEFWPLAWPIWPMNKEKIIDNVEIKVKG